MAEVEIIKASLVEGTNESEFNHLKKRVCAYCRVSTDSEEQQTSYVSQIKHYSTMIKKNPEWEFVGIYADEGITGTQIKNRDQFKQMIEDAKSKKIDIIIAKSISRFARNTVDTLNTVRLLRGLNVDVFFEKENIRTLTMDSEMFLTLYSAFAQAESESTSMNVKMGYLAKMKRGEACGSIGTYGFDYDKTTKELIINKTEAKVVKKIFDYYLKGLGSTRICNKLMEEHIPAPMGGNKWHSGVIKDILRNVKYIGDICGQKFFVSSPITHKLVRNRGQKPRYYSKNHHEAIIDIDTWNKVQDIYNKRSVKIKEGKQYCEKFSLRYLYSSNIVCGYCGHNYVRRKTSYTNKDGNVHSYVYWVCSSSVVKNKCIKRIAIRDEELNSLFVDLFNKLSISCDYNIIFGKIIRILEQNNDENEIKRLNKEEELAKSKISKLIDLKLNDELTEELFLLKNGEITAQIKEIQNKKQLVLDNLKNIKKQKDKIKIILKELESSKKMEKFDETIFKKIVKKVQIGDYDDKNIYQPNLIRFILNFDISADYNKNSLSFLSLECDGRYSKTSQM